MVRSLMVQGTASYVGKSILVTGICRIFFRSGYRVAPFKAQNMSLNSYATREGGEIGRAQVVQAEAAGTEPSIHMNPILIKPTGETGSQVIIQGRPFKNLSAKEFYQYKSLFFQYVKQSYQWLARHYDLIVIEGAGSPAEINLKDEDIVNMAMARYAQAPVLLVSDIDRGGAFASLIGTWEILSPEERQLIKGIIINKFRGDPSLLRPGLDYLEDRTGVPILGIVPYLRDLQIDQEDSVWMEEARTPYPYYHPESINIAVIRLPRISNFTDFDPLAREPGVNLYYVEHPGQLREPQIIIIPGSKNTIADLLFLKETGLAEKILQHARKGGLVIGICGGYQMLGQVIRDQFGVESTRKEVAGLGLLDISTRLNPDKITHQVIFRSISHLPYLQSAEPMRGYEIHMGQTEIIGPCRPIFQIIQRSNRKIELPEGAINERGNVFGTYIHGIFDNQQLRSNLLALFRETRRERKEEKLDLQGFKERQYDKLAEWLKECLDLKRIYELVDLPLP